VHSILQKKKIHFRLVWDLSRLSSRAYRAAEGLCALGMGKPFVYGVRVLATMPGEESQCALETLQKNIFPASKYLKLQYHDHQRTSSTIAVEKYYLLCCLPVLKARARLELREVATEQDAKDVVEVMKFRSTQFM